MAEVLVLGAGVSGLTAAVRLLRDGHRVRVVTADDPLDTVSAVAAAVWYPYRVAPADRVAAWGARTVDAFAELAEDPATGVRMAEGTELWRTHGDLWSAPALAGVRRTPLERVPPGYAGGQRLRLPVVEMPVYLRWLAGRVAEGGGTVARRAIASLEEALAECPVVVNCTGLGARELVPDAEMVPVRGQVVRVENPGLTDFFLDVDDPAGPAYVIPRSRDCVLGGTSEEGEWGRVPDPATAEAIVARCARLEPRVAGARILEHRVGLRPGRGAVRLEAEERAGGRVVHCYGHGGAGVTLSWGCAEEVAGLVG